MVVESSPIPSRGANSHMNENERDDAFKKSDREELLKHGWQLKLISSTLEEIKVSAKAVSDDARLSLKEIENRVRDLEQFKWIAWGIGSTIGALIAWFVTLWGNHKP